MSQFTFNKAQWDMMAVQEAVIDIPERVKALRTSVGYINASILQLLVPKDCKLSSRHRQASDAFTKLKIMGQLKAASAAPKETSAEVQELTTDEVEKMKSVDHEEKDISTEKEVEQQIEDVEIVELDFSHRIESPLREMSIRSSPYLT